MKRAAALVLAGFSCAMLAAGAALTVGARRLLRWRP